MKTKTQNPKSELQSRSEQGGGEKPAHTRNNNRPTISFERRRANRALGTEQLLALLRSQAPEFFALAEVVGEWVWIGFEGKQPPEVTRNLAELGFHWNNLRQTWQHPCGHVTESTPDDPRSKYGSYFAAKQQPA